MGVGRSILTARFLRIENPLTTGWKNLTKNDYWIHFNGKMDATTFDRMDLTCQKIDKLGFNYNKICFLV